MVDIDKPLNINNNNNNTVAKSKVDLRLIMIVRILMMLMMKGVKVVIISPCLFLNEWMDEWVELREVSWTRWNSTVHIWYFQGKYVVEVVIMLQNCNGVLMLSIDKIYLISVLKEKGEQRKMMLLAWGILWPGKKGVQHCS